MTVVAQLVLVALVYFVVAHVVLLILKTCANCDQLSARWEQSQMSVSRLVSWAS